MKQSRAPKSCYAIPAPLGPDEVRAKVAATAAARDETLVSISETLGRNPSYLQQYMERRSPKVLPEEVRLALAKHWRMDERELGARDPWRPVGNGDLVDDIAASIWLATTPDWPWEDAGGWRDAYRGHAEAMLAVMRQRRAPSRAGRSRRRD